MPFKYREIEKRLMEMGYRVVRQKGSLVIFSDGEKIFPVPNHGPKDISPGAERQLLALLNMSADEFRNIK